MPYVMLEKLHRMYDGYRHLFRVGDEELLLFQQDGAAYLLVNRCPHLGASLARASIQSGELRCPQHGIRFDIRSGRPLGAPGCASLRHLPIAYEGNTLGIYID